MSEIARIANQLNKLDSLIFRATRELQKQPGHEALAINIPGMEAVRHQLKRRFETIAGRVWLDVCKYRFQAPEDSFLPVRQIVETLGGFQHAVGMTMDALIHGKPKNTGRLSRTAAEEAALRFGYSEGGETFGDVGITLVVENRRDLLDSVNDSVQTVFAIAQSTDADQISTFSDKLGVAPIRAMSEWCQQHVRAGFGSRLDWVRDSQIRSTIAKSADQWKELKTTIDEVSDKLTEEIEIEGTLIAANYKTRAFVLQSGREEIHGRFRVGVLTEEKSAEIPVHYRFIIEKTVRRNYATDRVSTEYLITRLERLSRPPTPTEEEGGEE